MKLRSLIASIFVMFLLSGCGSNGVVWADYSPSVKTNIDTLIESADCEGLQKEFDNADANNEATMNRTGHNNAGLMDYIDAGMRKAGCY